MQKLKRCYTKWFVKAFLSDGNQDVTLQFNNDIALDVLKQSNNSSATTEEDVMMAFLSLSSLKVKFNKKNKNDEEVLVQ